MTLTYKKSREYLEHILVNVIELKSEYPIRKNLNHNDYDCIEDLFNIADMDNQNIFYETSTKWM